jgi:hypothetical protein
VVVVIRAVQGGRDSIGIDGVTRRRSGRFGIDNGTVNVHWIIETGVAVWMPLSLWFAHLNILCNLLFSDVCSGTFGDIFICSRGGGGPEQLTLYRKVGKRMKEVFDKQIKQMPLLSRYARTLYKHLLS